MQLEQAVFTSARTQRFQGYHLVARSHGIDDRMACELERWGPTEGSLVNQEQDASCFSFFQTADGRFVIGRSTYGMPEYSGRGSLQVVTFFLAVRPEQFAAYDSHALAVACTALALGHMRLTDPVTESLPPVELPDYPIVAAQCPQSDPSGTELSAEEFLQERVALVVGRKSESTAHQIISATPRERREALSFCTDLRPSMNRSFRLHIYRGSDRVLQRQLEDHRIRLVNTDMFGEMTPARLNKLS